MITKRSKDTEVDEEGCLSLREVLVPVERPTAVTIEGLDADGEQVKYELELPAARIVQHELAGRVVAAPPLTERQLRRIVYG